MANVVHNSMKKTLAPDVVISIWNKRLPALDPSYCNLQRMGIITPWCMIVYLFKWRPPSFFGSLGGDDLMLPGNRIIPLWHHGQTTFQRFFRDLFFWWAPSCAWLQWFLATRSQESAYKGCWPHLHGNVWMVVKLTLKTAMSYSLLEEKETFQLSGHKQWRNHICGKIFVMRGKNHTCKHTHINTRTHAHTHMQTQKTRFCNYEETIFGCSVKVKCWR